MRKTLIAASLAISALLAPAVQAAPVLTWTYDVESAWTPPATFSAGNGTQVETATEISWGGDNNGGAAGVGDLALGGERSGLQITNTPQIGQIDTNNLTPQPTNNFLHYNNPISGSFATLLEAQITTSLTLTPFNPAGPQLPTDTIEFTINFAETPNNGDCIDDATSNCDDVFVISFGSLDNQFDYDGFTYFVSIVQIVEGSLSPIIPLDNDACAAAGAPNGCLGFITPENAITEIAFGIVITSTPLLVPEPGILGLMGLGLLGLMISRRRKIA